MPQDASEISLHPFVLAETIAPDNEAPQAEDDIRSELDARQDEVLQLLDELNEQIEAVIREFAPPAADSTSALPAEVTRRRREDRSAAA